MIDKIAYDKVTPRCAWCGRPVDPKASRATLCGMICHNQTASGGNRRDNDNKVIIMKKLIPNILNVGKGP